ncbi:MAG: beta-ribofuranosylaminobenzene 5'-phosphate synthase family protein [Thiotrichales bacterium]
MNSTYVEIEAPARLHLGFLDLNGDTGRSFGSLGLTLDGLSTCLRMARSRTTHAEGAESVRATRLAQQFLVALGLPGGVHINLPRSIPPHAGLGSGTQLALAIGAGISRLHGLDLSPREVAAVLDRGQRSGIGIGAFERGGFLVDGGRRAGDEVPSITVRLEFPAHWRVVLLFDAAERGLHGEAERAAFRALPKFSAASAGVLCRVLAMQVLPGLVEQRLDEFGAGLGAIQALVGDHFAPAQGGRYASVNVAAALDWLGRQGHAALGQSSWGPTGFLIVDGETRAAQVVAQLQDRFGARGLQFRVVAARNQGAVVSEPGARNAPRTDPASFFPASAVIGKH